MKKIERKAKAKIDGYIQRATSSSYIELRRDVNNREKWRNMVANRRLIDRQTMRLESDREQFFLAVEEKDKEVTVKNKTMQRL